MKRLPSLLAAALAALALVTVGESPAHAAGGCTVEYRVNSAGNVISKRVVN